MNCALLLTPKSENLCLSVGVFRPFAFNMIVDMFQFRSGCCLLSIYLLCYLFYSPPPPFPAFFGLNEFILFFLLCRLIDFNPLKKNSVIAFYLVTVLVQPCPILCDPMDCSTLGFPVHHQLPEFTQSHVH